MRQSWKLLREYRANLPCVLCKSDHRRPGNVGRRVPAPLHTHYERLWEIYWKQLCKPQAGLNYTGLDQEVEGLQTGLLKELSVTSMFSLTGYHPPAMKKAREVRGRRW